MRRLGPIICALLLMMWTVRLATEPIQAQVNGLRTQVESAKSRPDLAVELESVTQLKVASRKLTFHAGEMIGLDIALLNSSKRPVFFRRLSAPRINVQSLTGEPLRIQPYGVVERAATPSSFTLVAPNEFDTGTFQLLVGCDRRAFDQLKSTDQDGLTAFKQELFLNWGDSCLNLTRPGTYILTAEIENDYVIVSSRRGEMKTAVGKIKSNPLKITIIE
jgi:hypothetical protein